MTIPLAAALTAAVGFATVARADLVFSQPSHANPTHVGLGFYSQSAPRPTRNYLHADNVTLTQSALVSRIVWWGLSEGVDHADLTNFTSFTLTLHSAKLRFGRWLPNKVLATETFALEATAPTLTGRAAPANGALEYRHEVTLAAPFALDAGTVYFVSIGAGFVDGASDAWMWQDSDTAEKNSAVYSYATDSWSSFNDTDSALQLYSVPSPGTLALALVLTARRPRR